MLIVDFINVGYGDAILIREKKDDVAVFSVLVDCGDVETLGRPTSFRIHAADFLAKEGISHLDLLVLTHLHLDHIGGLKRLINEVGISECWVNYLPQKRTWGNINPAPENASEGAARLIEAADIFSDFLKKAQASGTKIYKLQGKCSFRAGDIEFDLTMADSSLLNRQQEILDRLYKGDICLEELDELHGFINGTSLHIRMEYAGKSFELTSDISADHLLHMPCTVIKVPHHGHSDSMTPELADALGADYAVISVSDDREDNCPNQAVIKMLKDCGTKVLLTDSPESGSSVRFTVSDNGRLSCISLKNEKELP